MRCDGCLCWICEFCHLRVLTEEEIADMREQTNHFNAGSLMQRGIRLIGNGQAPVHKYWDELLQKIRNGSLDPTVMISHRTRLEDMDKVYEKFDAKDDSMQKVFVETKFSFPRANGTPELTRY